LVCLKIETEAETQTPTKKEKNPKPKEKIFFGLESKIETYRLNKSGTTPSSIRMSTLAIRAIRSRLPTIDETEETEELIDSPKSPEGTKFKLLLRRHPTSEKFMVICEREDGTVNADAWLSEERADDTISWWQKRIKEGGHLLSFLFDADN
jgi:hypothetical protein